MEFLRCLYLIFIGPLELLFEFVFSMSYKISGNEGISIIVLSIVMNLLALPLYRRADAMQKEQSDKMKSVAVWQERIRKTFKGDERFMMLNALNREKGIHPADALKGSVSLLLEIPFFIAAFRMLSSLHLLDGKSFLFLKDLGSPDGFINMGGFSVNFLPILMTAINIISSSIYLKDSDRKSKIQLYGIAAIFLVLLYNSPAGLVFYWTCNNIFSLVKNLIPSRGIKKNVVREEHGEKLTFISYGVTLSVFIGLMIPADFLRRAVGDFILVTDPYSPARYLLSTFSLAAGCFLVWMGVIYFLSSSKKIVNCVMISLSLVFILDYYAFYKNYGNLNKYLVVAFGDFYVFKEDILLNLAVIAMCAVLVFIIYKNKPAILRVAIIPFFLAASIVSVRAVSEMDRIYRTYDYLNDPMGEAEVPLSRDGKNVMVIMLDRAQGFMFRYMIEEDPSLKETFSGFTYYPNTISFGRVTNLGAPALFGGYDYTPENINGRSGEKLVDKHNESLLVLPVLFSENGYDVTVIDVPYAGYKMIPDLSLYDPYEGINAFRAEGLYDEYAPEIESTFDDTMRRSLFCYSLYLVSPMFMRTCLYDNGYYNDLNSEYTDTNYYQIASDISTARGMSADFLDSYSVLTALPSMTEFTEGGKGSFIMMDNNTAHSPALLEEPSYEPAAVIDNSIYDSENADRFLAGDVVCNMDNANTMAHYQAEMAAIYALGEWFDLMRSQGVYDNTRIIIVADHGAELDCVEGAVSADFNALKMNPLLLVKDFDSVGFTISDELMTNAESPYLAVNGLIEDPVNPFTGNPIVSMAGQGDILVSNSNDYDVEVNNGNEFIPGPWYRLTGDDILDLDSWEYQGTW
ncbi:MAG TPA: hypothetical protein DCW41_06535 [Clostridiales bacterium]|nr:hypothetical protein [Clostridiales bacterium]